MKDSPSPPPAPDPNQTAQAQTQSNLQTAIANARLNRVNQQTPWGSINYTQGPVDANGVPTYSSNITLSPAQQQLLDQQNAMATQRNQIAQQLLGQVGNKLAQPLNLSGLHAMYDPATRAAYAGAINASSGLPAGVDPNQVQFPTQGGQDPSQFGEGPKGLPPVTDLSTAAQQPSWYQNPQIQRAMVGALAGLATRSPAMGVAGALAGGLTPGRQMAPNSVGATAGQQVTPEMVQAVMRYLAAGGK